MRRIIPTLCLALLTILACSPLLAATPIDQTRPLDPRGRIEIDNLKGRIQVRACKCEQVRITGSLGEGVEKLVVEGDRNHLVVRAQYPHRVGAWRNDRTGPTDLRLQVPLQARLDIESVSADIDVNGVAPGSLDIDTVSGNVDAAAAPGRANIQSVSGDLRLTLNSADARAETVSGDLTLGGRLDGEVHVETVSGDISLDSNGESLRRVSAGTVSGDTGMRIGLAKGGQIKAETVSGDLRLRLPKSLSARVSAESFSGDLVAPGAKVHKEDFGPGSSIDQRYGDGSGEIHLETFSGDVTLVLE